MANAKQSRVLEALNEGAVAWFVGTVLVIGVVLCEGVKADMARAKRAMEALAS